MDKWLLKYRPQHRVITHNDWALALGLLNFIDDRANSGEINQRIGGVCRCLQINEPDWAKRHGVFGGGTDRIPASDKPSMNGCERSCIAASTGDIRVSDPPYSG